MFNCPSVDLSKRKLLKPVEYNDEVCVYNLIPIAKELVDADGVKYDGIEYVSKLVKTYSLQEYIESFADEVGIQNILKKLAISGDKSILNQTGREPLNPNGGLEPIQDYTDVPESKAAAFNIVSAGVAAYDKLPDEIKGDMSLEQFVKNFDQYKFDQYVESIKAKYLAAAKGEDK